MEKVLNQEEIDAMFRAARGAASVRAVRSSSYPALRSSPGGADQEGAGRAISILHEGFARNLTHSLGAYLRVVFETNLVSVEQLTFREFLQRSPISPISASFQVNPMGARRADLDPSLIFPIIDLLLGGIGAHE